MNALTPRYPSPLRGGSDELSGGQGGGSHGHGLTARGYPHPTSLRLATLPARGRDKKELRQEGAR
ncbi:MAG: hypothetical protein JWQ17_2455 [Tardiphaga sp.]|nr:hypothetical protein [Tardiphaga sp.]